MAVSCAVKSSQSHWFSSNFTVCFGLSAGQSAYLLKNKKQQRKYLLAAFCILQKLFLNSTIYRDVRQKQSISCGRVHVLKPKRDVRSSLPFSLGSRVCSLFFCCVAEMFFSSLYCLFVVIISLWAAKVRNSFELTKNYMIFSANFYVFFHKISTFAAHIDAFY